MKIRIKKQVFNAINTIHTPQYKTWYWPIWRTITIEPGVYEFYSKQGSKTWAEQHMYAFISARFKHKKAIGLKLVRQTKKIDYYTIEIFGKK